MKEKTGHMILARTQPLVFDGRFPIYWHKDVAEENSKRKRGGRVVKVKIIWQE